MANDSPGPANESNQVLLVTGVSAVSGRGGAVRLAGATVRYLPPTNYLGPDGFTYVLTDDGRTRGQPDPLTATGTVSVTVVAVTNRLGIRLTSPTPDASYCPEAPMVFAATVDGPIPRGSEVEFQLDGQFLARATTVPFNWMKVDDLAWGQYRARARLWDRQGLLRAESPEVMVQVTSVCQDVAIVRNYADPEVDEMEALIQRPRWDNGLGYIVRVFDQGVSTGELLGYKLILWAGLTRPDEGLTGADVDQLLTLRAAGKPLFLMGARVLSDRSRLSAGRRAAWEQLCGLSWRGSAATNARLRLLPAGYGDLILEGPGGPPDAAWVVTGRVEAGDLVVTNEYQVKMTIEDAPVMVSSPGVCDPDLGQTRLVAQAFGGVSGNEDTARLFKNTVRWLLREWVCENLEVNLEVVEGPPQARVGQIVDYSYRVATTGGCGAIGVVISEELPAGWLVCDVESGDRDSAWEEVSPWLVTTLGCLNAGAGETVVFRLMPIRPGTFTHTVTLAAAHEAFDTSKHVVRVVTVVEAPDVPPAPPRLGLRRGSPQGPLELWLFGDAGITYGVERSTDLVTWDVCHGHRHLTPRRFRLRCVNPESPWGKSWLSDPVFCPSWSSLRRPFGLPSAPNRLLPVPFVRSFR